MLKQQPEPKVLGIPWYKQAAELGFSFVGGYGFTYAFGALTNGALQTGDKFWDTTLTALSPYVNGRMGPLTPVVFWFSMNPTTAEGFRPLIGRGAGAVAGFLGGMGLAAMDVLPALDPRLELLVLGGADFLFAYAIEKGVNSLLEKHGLFCGRPKPEGAPNESDPLVQAEGGGRSRASSTGSNTSTASGASMQAVYRSGIS